MKKLKLFIYLIISTLAIPIAQAQNPEGLSIKGEALFGALRARQIGPAVMSGRISDIEGVNRNPKMLYVAAANGGVWKSQNGGTSFEPIFDKYTQSIGKIAVDQLRPDTIWVGTGEPWVRNSVSVGTGVYKTTDGGKSWQFKGLPDSERISDIVIDPQNPNTVYVGVLGHLWNGNAERGVFKTTDGGDTWTKVLFVDDNTGCADMAIDPRNPQVIYATMWEFRRMPYFFNSGGKGSAVYKTIDGGKTWNKAQTGIPNVMLGRMAVEIAPSKPDVVYLTVEAKDKDHRGLYKSTDAGANWKKINDDFNMTVRPFYFARLVVDPKNDSVVYKMGLQLIVSKDGGDKFRVVGGAVHSDMHDVWVHPQQTEIVYVATDGGLYRSMDGAYSFEHLKSLPLSQFYHVSVDDAIPYNVYGGLQDNGSWHGPSRSANGIENRDWVNVGGGDGFWVFPHPKNKETIFAEYQGGNLLRFNRKTEQSKDIKPYALKGDPKLRFNWNTPIHISRNNPERMYYGAQFLFVSEDMGDTWQKISPDLTTNDPIKQNTEASGGLTQDNSSAENHCTLYAIAESPKNEKIIWAGTDDGNLQVTQDGGKTWTNVTANVSGLPKNTWVSFVEPSNFETNTCYVTFDGHRHGDKKVYVYKTTDLGKTWTPIATPEIKGFAHVIKEDLKNANLLFVGTEFGLFISVDGGKNWSQFMNNMPPVAVMDMAIHPSQDDLVLATHGRGVIIIDDITPLRQINKDILAKDVHFFEMKPVVFANPSGFQDFTGDGEFVGANPSDNAQITYYLRKRHTFGDMYLEVFDEAGKLIQKLAAGKGAGINRVEWATRLKRPKVATGQTITFGGFSGPTLPEAKYTVKMTKGKETYTTYLTLTANPNLPYTSEERKLQQQTALKLYDMTEQLAYIADGVQSMKKQADERAKAAKKMAKTLTAFSLEMENLNKKMVITTGDNYVASAEPQLREKISEVYGSVANFAGRPSNSQIESMKTLDADLQAIQKKFDEIRDKKLPILNKQLTAEKMEEIKIKTWEEFKKIDSE
jgi:photosystem II stability/assembly factor-like uncharacterized protein